MSEPAERLTVNDVLWQAAESLFRGEAETAKVWIQLAGQMMGLGFSDLEVPSHAVAAAG